MCNVQLIPTLGASSTVHSDNLDPELSYEIGISGASSLADILRVEMSLLCFFPSYYALSNSQEMYQLC